MGDIFRKWRQPSFTEACNTYTVLRFVIIIAQVNLFYAVTPDWEISLSYMSLEQIDNICVLYSALLCIARRIPFNETCSDTPVESFTTQVYSFIHSFIHLFIHNSATLIHLFFHSFIHSLIRSCNHPARTELNSYIHPSSHLIVNFSTCYNVHCTL